MSMKIASPPCLAPVILVAGLLGAVSASAAPVDLNTWSEKGPPGNGVWNVAVDGSSVTQTVNGNPTFFTGSESLIDRDFGGTLRVATTADDDYIGIVFGYQTPTGNTNTDTNQDFFAFSWKQGAQSGDPAGMFLAYVNGTNVLSFGDYSSSDNRAGYTAFDNVSLGGWQDNTDYNFSLLYETDNIRITMQSDADADFTTVQTVFDVSLAEFNAQLSGNGQATFTEFPSGQFGFFNHSQANVIYSGITDNATPVADAGGPYVFDAANLLVVLDGSGSVDPDGGAIQEYQWTPVNGPGLSGVNPGLSLAASGLTSTTDSQSVSLTVVDDEESTSPADTATVSYDNAAPFIVSAVATRLANGDVEFAVTYDDVDLIANTVFGGFEALGLELDISAALDLLDFDGGFANDSTNGGSAVTFTTTISYADLLVLFGGQGTFNAFANVRDMAGLFDSESFSVLVQAAADPGTPGQPVPEPMSLLLMGAGLLGLGASRRRRA